MKWLLESIPVLAWLIYSSFLYPQDGHPIRKPEIQNFYSRHGIEVLAPAERLLISKSKLTVFEMQVTLSAQQKRAQVTGLQNWRKRRPLPGKFTLLEDNFEKDFPGSNWQILRGIRNLSWSRRASNPFNGSYSIGCSGSETDSADHDYANHSLTWLISAPYDLSQTKSAGLNLYAWLRTEADYDVFFCGVSVDGDRFYGLGMSGNSEGWQFINLNLNDVPIIGKATGASQVWIGFFFVSNDSITDRGVFVDDVEFFCGEGWHEQNSAVLDDLRNPNAFSGGVGLARPAFVDIDDDHDFDLFVGKYDGSLNFYRNDGSRSGAQWILVTGRYADIDVGENSAPAFCDIDGDGDEDLFLGSADGSVTFYRNNGSSTRSVWDYVGKIKDRDGKLIDVGNVSTPTFVDLDRDDDFDLVIGDAEGFLGYYRNDSQDAEMAWTLVRQRYLGVDVGSLSAPTFADTDEDGEDELFTGIRENTIYFYERTKEPEFTLQTKEFAQIQVGDVTAPAFADLDGDKDLDLCIGQADGNLAFFDNVGSQEQPRFKPARQPFQLQTLDVGFQCAPSLVDLDADGDLDLILGSAEGKFHFYKNTGSAKTPEWRLTTDYFKDISVKGWSTPTFVDIDRDGDLDLFSGSKAGVISFFRNEGSKSKPSWQLISDSYASIQVGGLSVPAFADLDGDRDYDLFIGTDAYGIAFYENIGTSQKPQWKQITRDFMRLKYNFRSAPRFVDLDGDGDLDFFTGSRDGILIFGENEGDKRNPRFRIVTNKYNEINVRFFSVPAFADLDQDGDLDLFLGNNSGGLYFWRNFYNQPTAITQNEAVVDKIRERFAFKYVIPLPFSKGSRIRYQLNRDSEITITVKNLRGELVNVLVDEFQTKGEYAVAWDGANSRAQGTSGGLYFVAFSVGGRTNIAKLVLID